MKKLLSILTLMLCVGAVNAQFGIQAGAVFYSGKLTADNISLKYDTKVGFTAGVVYSAALSSNFSFMPSLNFTQKGGKYSFEDGDEDKLTLSYIELPLNFVYNTSGKGGHFFIGAGPDLAFGVGGKEEFAGEKVDINFGNGADDDFKAFEFGLNIIAGYQFDNGLFIAGNYNPGISDIAPDDSGGGKYHNMGFGIRLGYMFKKMAKKSSDTQ